jgi:hypothetical protein
MMWVNDKVRFMVSSQILEDLPNIPVRGRLLFKINDVTIWRELKISEVSHRTEPRAAPYQYPQPVDVDFDGAQE